MLKKFRYMIFSEIRKGSATNFFGTVRQKISTENLDTLSLQPPLLSKSFLTTGKNLEHSTEGFLYKTFRYCETKQFRRKTVILTPSYIPKMFRYQNFVNHRRVLVRSFSVQWDTKFLISINFLDNPD